MEPNQVNKFHNVIKQFLKYLRKENYEFVFLPHCTYSMDHELEDDRNSHKLAEKLKEIAISLIKG